MTVLQRFSLNRGGRAEAATDARAPDARSIDTVVMATDLSARSDRALERAIELADRHDAQLTILHIVDEDLPAAAQDQVAAAARDEIETRMRKLGRSADVDAGVSVVITPGKDYRDILVAASDGEADLIVLGTHRNEAGRRPIAGTTMERVIRKGTQPVLVVSDQVKRPYEKLMIAVDFSIYSRLAIRNAFALAPDADFYFVHAFHVPFEGFQGSDEARRVVREKHEQELTRMIEEEMDSLIRSSIGPPRTDRQAHKIVRHGEVFSVLRAEADRIDPDLLVLGTHGRVGVAHAVLGSVAEDFLNRPPCDVLAVKAW